MLNRSIKLDEPARGRVLSELAGRGEFLTFGEDPHLASLCTIIGLIAEMGSVDCDRLGVFFGVDPQRASVRQAKLWRSRILTGEDGIGVEFSLAGAAKLELRHPDLRYLLHPSSLDERGRLSRIVLFPAAIAKTFERRGLRLVIVRDWLDGALTSSGVEDHYFYGNVREIEENVAWTQARMLSGGQLAFSGTHDIADHLLGFELDGLRSAQALASEVADFYEQVFGSPVFERQQRATHRLLLLSYVVGVVLDDLAQPKWYRSQAHHGLVAAALGAMRSELNAAANEGVSDDIPRIPRALRVPDSMHALVACLRNEQRTAAVIDAAFADFWREISA